MSARDQLAALSQIPEATLDLGAAAAQIARVAYPDLEPSAVVRLLDRVADGARPGLAGVEAGVPRLAALCRHLFEELGFKGNMEAYYDPRNSYLNDVLERRLGIPITLSVVLIEVGRRLELRLKGVGFPGHFLVRHDGLTGPTFVDPVSGSLMAEEGCRQLLARLSRDTLPFRPEFLRPIGSRAILLRMLRNLKGIALKAGDPAATLELVELSLALASDQPRERRDRGLLCLATGRLRPAVDELAGYLRDHPQAPDRVPVKERLAEARRRLYAIN